MIIFEPNIGYGVSPDTGPSLEANSGLKNMILFIGDGMGPEQIRAAGFYLNGTAGTLSFESFPFQGEVTTYSASSSVTDSAAAATAMATGIKVNNRVISVALPGDGRELATLLEYYAWLGKSTGLVTRTYMTHATPASFGAHEEVRSNLSQIAVDYFSQTRPTLLLGGGGKGVTLELARDNGYTVVTNTQSMKALVPVPGINVSGQFGDGNMPYASEGNSHLPSLLEMTETALEILSQNEQGFFLMVEGGRIDHAGHANNIENVVHETIAFHKAVEFAYQWARNRGGTIVLVTADHETGGLTVLQNNGKGQLPTVSWSGTGHTGVNVGVYAFGGRGEEVAGVIDNTDIYGILKVNMNSQDLPPFGSFDAPVNDSTVNSSIAVTGWALDDVGLKDLAIYRDPVQGEGTELIYIGEGIFTPGARPDVETAFPFYPGNHRAGWGYMLLTNMLPNGNGTFTLHAVATDVNGNSGNLGSKKIIVDNRNASKPFGAIDAPEMGESISSQSYRVLGWALTPNPGKIPRDGSTMRVLIDGRDVGQVTYDIYRPDIAALFPGYANSDAPHGYFDLDTGSLETGLHTISWQVTDSNGNSDGIGSRYFTITR